MASVIRKFAILCIFSHYGHTYTFRDGEIICDNETFLQFNYTAMSDGRVKVGHFPKENICGWSVTAPDVEI